MKKIILLFTAIVFSVNVFSQVTFQKTYGYAQQEKANCVQQTTDGGYIVVGNTSSSVNIPGIYAIKTNASGDTTWTKIYQGTFANGYYIQECMEGGYIIIGQQNYSSNTVPYLIRINAIGDTIWTRSYYNFFGATAFTGMQTSDSGFVMTGWIYTSSYDVLLFKTDRDGHLQWVKSYGGGVSDRGNSVIQTFDGGYIIAGNTNSFGLDTGAVYLIKTNSTGNLLWSKTFGSSGENGAQILQTNDGGYIMVGNIGYSEGILIRTDGSGNATWSKTYTSYMSSLEQTNDQGYLLSYPNLIKTDSSGTILWSKRYSGNSGYLISARQTSDGGYIAAGYYQMFTNNKNVYLVKTNAFGQSGCNENAPLVNSSPLTLQINIPSTSTTTPTLGELNTSWIVGSGTIDSLLCFSFPTGIKETSNEKNISLSPNPAKGELYINGYPLNEKGEIEIYNTLGEKRLTPTLSKGEGVRVDVSSLPAGVYFVAITDDKGNKITKRFIKI